MARRGTGGGGLGGGGAGGMMAPVISIATGLIVFVVLIIFAPTIAGSIQETQPVAYDTCNVNTSMDARDVVYCKDLTTQDRTNANFTIAKYDDWLNATHSGVPDGVSVWTTNVQILGVVVLIISIAIAMYYLKGMA